MVERSIVTFRCNQAISNIRYLYSFLPIHPVHAPSSPPGSQADIQESLLYQPAPGSLEGGNANPAATRLYVHSISAAKIPLFPPRSLLFREPDLGGFLCAYFYP